MGGPHTTCEGWRGNGRVTHTTCEGWGGDGGPCYALVRCGEGMGGVAVVHCMCPSLVSIPDAPDRARSQKQSSLDRYS